MLTEEERTLNTDDLHRAAYVYRLLGDAFLEPPDEERVEAVKSLVRYADGAEDACVGDDSHLSQETGFEDLRTWFTRLFMGVGQGTVPPPYESVYLEGRVYGSSTTEVQRAYRKTGHNIRKRWSGEPPDHIGLELHYIAELCEQEANTLSEGGEGASEIREAREEFIETHLRAWVDKLREKCLNQDPPPYYRAILDITVAVVDGGT